MCQSNSSQPIERIQQQMDELIQRLANAGKITPLAAQTLSQGLATIIHQPPTHPGQIIPGPGSHYI